MFYVVFIDSMMNQLPPVSEALYVGLYNEIGTPTEVNISRGSNGHERHSNDLCRKHLHGEENEQWQL